MVECEYQQKTGSLSGRSGFNRYMVECELIYHKSIFSDDKVLIDTWWNVNPVYEIVIFKIYLF